MKNVINLKKNLTLLFAAMLATYTWLEAKLHAPFSELQRAVIQGNTEEVSRLIEESPELVHERDEGGETILFDLDITRQNVDEIGKLLIKTGADVNAQDETGMTPLHHAVTTKNLALVRFLLKSGADSTIKDNDGVTPLSLVLSEDNDLQALFAKYAT